MNAIHNKRLAGYFDKGTNPSKQSPAVKIHSLIPPQQLFQLLQQQLTKQNNNSSNESEPSSILTLKRDIFTCTQPTSNHKSTTNNQCEQQGHRDNDYFIGIYSSEDGRSAIIELTRLLSNCVKNRLLSPTQINATLLHQLLTMACNADEADKIKGIFGEPPIDQLQKSTIQFWPSPDFVLKMDGTNVMGGFLPWHLRYSEILHLETFVDKVDYRQFFEALTRYSNCVQRFGK